MKYKLKKTTIYKEDETLSNEDIERMNKIAQMYYRMQDSLILKRGAIAENCYRNIKDN